MSPPIRDGSGNSIGAIRLGDGSEIAEVRTGAGDVLFSALPDSVVSHWEFEDEATASTATDSESNNDLDIVGGATYTTDSAVGSNAIDFPNGTDSGDRLTVSNSDGDFNSGNGEFAVSMWVKFRDSTKGALWQVYATDSSLYRVLNPNRGSSSWSFDTAGDSNENISYGFPTNTYEHYVFQRNSSDEIELYVNGSFKEVITTNSTTLNINGEFHLGYDDKGGTEWGLDGVLDDVFFFGAALTQSEIDNLYARGT